MNAREAAGQQLGASFRDPSGFLFSREGSLFRQVNRSYQRDYDHLMGSGLYEDLVSAGLLIAHHEADVSPAVSELAYKVIQPEKVAFISYPYEWSFSQLKDAALATLQIQKRALACGMSLKDSSAYNIQFHQGRPILIDTLSFEIYQEGKPWDAYRQFCQHFLAPLSLMAYRDVRLGQLLRVYIDGLPLDLASRLLPASTRLVLPLLLHLHLHASAQKRYAGTGSPGNLQIARNPQAARNPASTNPQAPAASTRQVSRTAFLGLIDSLEAGIRRLRWLPEKTEWGAYYEATNYTPAGLEHKQQLVSRFLDGIQPAQVWDLGANTGLFSRLASERGIPTVAFDVDPGAVEKNYLETLSRGEKNLLPLLLDLTNPSPNIGWNNQERASLSDRGPVEAVLALALIHHLAIANNLPLERLASFFHQTGRNLIIEFVPKSDSQVQRLLATRADIFPGYTVENFEQVFAGYFTIHQAEKVHESERRLYWMEAR